MSYLFIDLEKPTVALHHISEQAGAVYLFTKRKRNRKIAKQFAKQHPTAKAWHAAKDERLSDCLLKKLKQLVKSKPQARIVVASHGKRLARKLDQLLNRYPNANVVLLDKKQKKAKPESAHQKNYQENQQQEMAHPPIIMAAPLLLNKPAEMPLLDAPKVEILEVSPETNQATDKEWQNVHQAIVLLKKNRPRKRAALMEALCNGLRLTPEAAVQLIEELEGLKVIEVDIAENVRYR